MIGGATPTDLRLISYEFLKFTKKFNTAVQGTLGQRARNPSEGSAGSAGPAVTKFSQILKTCISHSENV